MKTTTKNEAHPAAEEAVTPELKPCPWGCVVRIEYSWLPTYVFIGGCAHTTFAHDATVDATGAPDFETAAHQLSIQWNTRATDAETQRLREALRGAKEYLDSLLGDCDPDCDPDCDCIIHIIDAAFQTGGE